MTKLSNMDLIQRILDKWNKGLSVSTPIYGVPRGGWNIAMLLDRMGYATQVNEPHAATIIVDDIIDSGSTRERWKKKYPDKQFWAPYDKTQEPNIPWVVFPWEGDSLQDGEDVVRRILQLLGENPAREGLIDTPKRVVKSWKELYAGYLMKPEDILSRHFKSDNDAMVICRDIEFYSTCEHHMIPFYGTVSIGYLPKGTVVGLSKLARLVECFARRLQIQEQLTSQIATALMKAVPDALGTGVVIRAKHLCMCGRGISKQGSSMVTSAMLGKFRDDPAVRSEFLQLINNSTSA